MNQTLRDELINLRMKMNTRESEQSGEVPKFRIEDIPIKKFFDQAQYIDRNLLPTIEQKRGAQSVDYVFFQEVYKSLLYAVVILDRFDNLLVKVQHENQISQLLQARLDLCEKELQKYITLEDLFATDALDRYKDVIAKRVNDILTNK